MKEGVTREQLATELTQLSKELPARFGGPPSYAKTMEQHRALVDPLLDRVVGPVVRTSLWVLLGAVAVVLLIACANVANLFLVRAEGRRRDMAVRRAIGASRTQLVRLQMSEAFLVALVGGVLAIVIAKVSLPLFLRAAPEGIPRLAQAGLDVWTFVTAFALVIITALACGTVPALRASAPDLTRLREGGRGSTGQRHWGRDMLVVGQTALALVLLIGSALLVQSFNRLRNVDPGYDTKDLYTFQYAPEQPQLNTGPDLGRLHLRFMDMLRALPGVTGVGVVNNIPLDEGTNDVRFLTEATQRGRRNAAQHELRGRRLLQGDGNRPAPGAPVHHRRSGDDQQQRRHQPRRGSEALARPGCAGAAHPANFWTGTRSPGSPWSESSRT